MVLGAYLVEWWGHTSEPSPPAEGQPCGIGVGAGTPLGGSDTGDVR